MSNADRDIIPIVEDDKTGETYVDLLEFVDIGIFPHSWEVPKEKKTKTATQVKIEHEDRLNILEKKINRIMIHLGIDDKSEILIIKELNK